MALMEERENGRGKLTWEEGLIFIPLPQSARWGSHPEPPVLPPALAVVPLRGNQPTRKRALTILKAEVDPQWRYNRWDRRYYR